MKLNKLAPKKNLAQAMVEFAIVLPLLLLLLYGLLEAGRLLFMYSTIVTASRQAVRYGSATGEGSTPGVLRYDDCSGIRLAANKVDYLNAFDHTGIDVTIGWDTGPGTTVNPICPTGEVSDAWSPSGNADRLVVTITGHFNPIVPKIIPFLARSIIATSARTILTGVQIEVTSPAGTPGAGLGGSLLLTITPNPTSYSALGQTITYTYTLNNSSNPPVDITGPFTITDSLFGTFTCTIGTLTAGATADCPEHPTYTVTQNDLDTGRIISNSATASGGGGSVISNQATATVPPALQPQLTLAKSATPAASSIVGQVITYTYHLTNSGNVTLLPPFAVADDKTSVTCPQPASLAISTSIDCTSTYTIKQTDINNKTVINNATATATYNSQVVTSNAATFTVYTPALYLTATVSPSSVNKAGQVITYTYTFHNNTNIALSAPYALSGGRGSDNCAANTNSLAAGATFNCTGTYTVTQADLDAGTTLINTVVASASSSNKTETSNAVTLSVTITTNPALTLQASATPTAPVAPAIAMTLNQPITYTYTLTNTGNVTLSTVVVTDTKVTNITCPTTLAPGATQTCTATYLITQADIDAGGFTSQATATATYKTQPVTASAAPITITTYKGARLRLQITANPPSFTGPGQFIVYTYTLTNTGSLPLNGPFSTSDNKADCSSATSPLAVGGSTTCVWTYTTTAADYSAIYIDYSTSARGSDGVNVITSNSSSATVSVQGAPTRTPTPVPTATGTPTPTVTPVPVCSNITAGNISVSAKTMSMTITNPNTFAVTVSTVQVKWNANGGTGNPPTLTLQSASLGSTTFWTGSNSTGNVTITPSTTLTIPGNSIVTTITFTFDKNYQTPSNNSIIINLSTPGCSPIHKP